MGGRGEEKGKGDGEERVEGKVTGERYRRKRGRRVKGEEGGGSGVQ